MRTIALLAALVALGGGIAAPAAVEQTGSPAAAHGAFRLVDLTDEFVAFREDTIGQPQEERVAAFKTRFEELIPGFYTRRDDERYHANIGRALEELPRYRSGFEEVSRRFSTLFEPALASFEAEFGRFADPQPIYLLHSFGEMDGGTRSLPEGNRLIFGADMIARLHLEHDIMPFFHHELFHVYHQRLMTSCETVGCALWGEGLATYVAATLNPGASDAELLLTIPEPIRPKVDEHIAEAACEVRSRLDSRDETDLQAIFSFERLTPDLPPRFGYYIGYLVAADLGRTRNLQELAAMPYEEVRAGMERALARMGECATLEATLAG